MKFHKKLLTLLSAAALSFGALSLTASAAGVQMQGIGFVHATSLRLRSEPNTASRIVDTAMDQECVVVENKHGQWYKVRYNLQQGYMHEDYLSVLSKENAELGYGQVIGSGVNLRSGPSTGYGVVGTAGLGDKVYIIGLNEGWYKVIFGSNICYIRSDFVELTEVPYENRDSSVSPKFFRGGRSTGVAPSAAALNGTVPQNPPKPEGTHESGGNPNTGDPNAAGKPSSSGAAILAEAQKHLGAPYVWGGASPAGFDCSGFVYYVLKTQGIPSYRTPEDQFRQGTPVDKSQLQPGDIVYFYGTYADRISHTGIYAGNGQFIHAPNSRSVVSYSNLESGYWADHYYGARRMV